MDALIARICDRLEAGGTRLGRALAAIWRGGRQPPNDPEDPAASSVRLLKITYKLGTNMCSI